uniref:Uncharacterized protein n=1 Tax=Rhizophora mucronata TaxID=61149 RepID=A0A2P2NKF9_RHIMU
MEAAGPNVKKSPVTLT